MISDLYCPTLRPCTTVRVRRGQVVGSCPASVAVPPLHVGLAAAVAGLGAGEAGAAAGIATALARGCVLGQAAAAEGVLLVAFKALVAVGAGGEVAAVLCLKCCCCP